MRTFFGLTMIGLVFAAICGAALAWDGSAYLYQILDARMPLVAHGRYINIPLQWPTLLAANFTKNVGVLQLIFSLVYASIPLIALALSWWIVRERAPMLFIWAALGIGLGTLPGQFFFVAEANLAVQLFWPLLMALLTRMPSATVPVAIVLMLSLFVTHPFAIALFALAAVVAALLGRRHPEEQRKLWLWAGVFAVLTVLGVLQLAIFRDSYEAEQLTAGTLSYAFKSAVFGLPLVGMICSWLAAIGVALLPLRPWRDASTSRIVLRASLGGIIVAGIALLFWARDVSLWRTELDFRYWTLFSSLPFVLLAIFEALRYEPAVLRDGGELRQQRTLLMQAAALVFALVLMVQSGSWFSLNRRLSDTIAQSPWACLSTNSLSWVKQSPLEHWSVSTDAMLLQGSAPTKLVLTGDGCSDAAAVSDLRLTSWLVPNWDNSWFDLQKLHTNVLGEYEYPAGCSYALTTGWFQTENDGPYWWRWSDGRDAQMRVLTNKDLQAAINGQIETYQSPNQVDVLVNGAKQTTVDITQTGQQPLGSIPIALKSGKNTIQFISRNPAVDAEGRALAMNLANVVLGSSDPSSVCRFHP